MKMSKCLVLLFYGKQYRSQKEVPKKYLYNYEVDQELGGGEMSLFACPGVGNRPPGKNKFANLRGCARGGGGEPCITSEGDSLIWTIWL